MSNQSLGNGQNENEDGVATMLNLPDITRKRPNNREAQERGFAEKGHIGYAD